MTKSVEKQNLWKERVENQKESGLSIKAWCKQNHISVSTFLYWRNRGKKSFRELVDDNPLSGLYISPFGNVEIRKEFDGFALKEVMKCLRNLQWYSALLKEFTSAINRQVWKEASKVSLCLWKTFFLGSWRRGLVLFFSIEEGTASKCSIGTEMDLRSGINDLRRDRSLENLTERSHEEI